MTSFSNIIETAWKVAGFLAPWLLRLLQHRRIVRWHITAAILILLFAALISAIMLIVALGPASASLLSPISPWVSRVRAMLPFCISPWVSLLPVGVTLISLLRVKFQQLAVGLERIESTLASQEEKLELGTGRIFWSNLPRLAPRQEISVIENRFSSTDRIVLLEGYSGSGKSAIAKLTGRRIVESGSFLLRNFVYYVNLTTLEGLPPGEDPISTIASALDQAVKAAHLPIYFIIEDIHHRWRDFENFNRFLDYQNIRILFTSRPLQESIEPSESGRLRPLSWIAKKNRISIRADEKILSQIIASHGARFKHLEEIRNFIGWDRPNLVLLEWAASATRHTGKLLDEISYEDVEKYLSDYWDSRASELGFEQSERTMLVAALKVLATLSEFEVRVTKPFVQHQCKNDALVLVVLDKLSKARDVILARPQLEMAYYSLPHSRMAHLCRKLLVKSEEERTAIIVAYLLEEPFFGHLMERLAEEERDYLLTILANFGTEIAQRLLVEASPSEIGSYFWALSEGSRCLAKQVIMVHEMELSRLNVKQAATGELATFYWGLYWASQPVAAQIAERHFPQLVEAGRGRSPIELGRLIWALGLISQQLARKLTDEYQTAIVALKITKVSLQDLSTFLQNVSSVNPDLCLRFIEINGEQLSKRLREAELTEIGEFIDNLGRYDMRLTEAVVNANRDSLLKINLRNVPLKESFNLISIIADASEEVALAVAERNRGLIEESFRVASLSEFEDLRGLDESPESIKVFFRDILLSRSLSEADLEEADLEVVAKYLKWVEHSYPDVISAQLKVLSNKLRISELEEVGKFLGSIDEDLAVEIVKLYREEVGQKLKEVELSELMNFFMLLGTLGGDFLMTYPTLEEPERPLEEFWHWNLTREVVNLHKDIISSKIESAGLIKLAECLRFLGKLGGGFAIELTNIHKDTIRAKLIEGTPNDIGDFFFRLAVFSRKVAESIAIRHREQVLAIDLISIALDEFVTYFRGVSFASGELGAELLKQHDDFLADTLMKLSLHDLGVFLRNLCMIGFLENGSTVWIPLIEGIAAEHEALIREKLDRATKEEREAFYGSIPETVWRKNWPEA